MPNVHEFEDYDDDYDDVESGIPLRSSAQNVNGGGNSRVHPVHGAGESQKLVADFDSFSSDAEKLSAILKVSDVEMHKHLLSVDYFRFRKYSLLVPTIVMSLIIAICGFVAASDIMKDSMRVHDATLQDFLTILVASFGFLVLLLTILGNGLDYNSKIGFHRAAAEDLASLCDKVRLYRMERAMDERIKEEDEEIKDLFDDDGSTSSEESDEDLPTVHEDQIVPHNGNAVVKKQMRQQKRVQKRQEKLTKTLVKQKVRQAREEQELSKDVITFYGYHTELHQIMRGCRSDVPPLISKFFHVMENRVELMSLSRLGVEEESRMRKNQIVRLCANEIYNEISNHWLWPVAAPGVDRTIEGALKRVGQLLNMNYRAQRRCKLIPCCPIPLCCKKSTTNNVFAIINEGIDQRELDMMQAERMEVVRMENERRARYMAGPEEVVEMRDTLYVEDPKGASGKARGRGQSGHPDYYAPADHSRVSRDPDGETYNDMTTEASFSFRGGSRAGGGGGYAAHYTDSPRDNLLPPADYLDDGMITEEDETFGGSYQDGTYNTASEEDQSDEGTKKKSKKKKKKKSKKKKKKKAKKKEREESVYDEEDEEEYSELPEEEEYTEYSEEYSRDQYSKEEYSEYSEED